MYLSPLVDCYNGEVVSYAISTRPQQGLVMKMLDLGKREMNPDDKPIVHSDQGSQYQSPVYVNALKEAGWIQSMSRKGCCPDNSACEGFFGRLKNEFFYNHDFSDYTVGAFATALSDWIEWYNNERIKDSLGYKSPVRYRLENACAAA
jgi:putative transposase